MQVMWWVLMRPQHLPGLRVPCAITNSWLSCLIGDTFVTSVALPFRPSPTCPSQFMLLPSCYLFTAASKFSWHKKLSWVCSRHQ
uniref:Uncharacterized protein n=1 Tax=Timema bartmani TaxID=61472 RepID=A0A7R9FCV7_9NEOP|nr:unnamed protein product [Timema bartmani]